MGDGQQAWALYVDESGPFEGHGEDTRREPGHSVVAGVLAPEPLSVTAASIEGALRNANPVAAWPHHAWYTHQPAMYALWSIANRGQGAVVPSAHLAQGIWRQQRRDVYDRTLEMLKTGREPSRVDVQCLSKCLERSNATLHAELATARDRAVSSTLRVLEAIANAEPPGSVSLFAALDKDDGLADPGGLLDPYLGALAAVLQRAAHALLLRGGRHDMQVRVLGRKVLAPFGSSALPMPMKTVHVADTARSACGGTLELTRAGAHVRLHAVPVAAFQAGLHPLHVVADFVAFSARPVLDQRSTLGNVVAELPLLAGLSATLERELAPLATGSAAAIPLIGADGLARDCIDRAYRAEPPALERLQRCRKRWIGEQARVMAAAWGA